VLTVRAGKFGKSRLVPLHPTTADALKAYARKRERLRPHRRSPVFFLSNVGAKVHLQNLGRVFRRLLMRVGIDGAGRWPRIHDLRHTFAMRTVHEWYCAGVDVERRLPQLSTYLGHVSPTSTYWYLTATPQLLGAAGKRAARAWAVRS
jgi:integrase